jgi:dUTP pyrophosphatase
MDEIIKFSKLNENAIIPTRGTDDSAGFDLYALEDVLIVGGAGNFLVPTGIAVELPEGTYGQIYMRSGLALKQHLTVTAGVIDRDYTGPIGGLVSSTKIFNLEKMEKLVYQEDTSLGWGYVEPGGLRTEKIEPDGELIVFGEKLGTLENVSEKLRVRPLYPVMTPHAYLIKKGERFAQLVIKRICYAPGIEVKSIENNDKRHEGFGSTGSN